MGKGKMLRIEKEDDGLCNSGKFTGEENFRILEAMKEGLQFRQVAQMLDRDPEAVRQKMKRLQINSNLSTKLRKFTPDEDLVIVDQMIPRLRSQKLNTSGFFDGKDLDMLGRELCRDMGTLRSRWEGTLQPWLLQHYTGTTGFWVELMLANLVAAKYTSINEVDWPEMARSTKEFSGHTYISLRRIYLSTLVRNAKIKQNLETVTPLQVFEYASLVYKPGTERKMSSSKKAQRQRVIDHFEQKIELLGINNFI